MDKGAGKGWEAVKRYFANVSGSKVRRLKKKRDIYRPDSNIDEALEKARRARKRARIATGVVAGSAGTGAAIGALAARKGKKSGKEKKAGDTYNTERFMTSPKKQGILGGALGAVAGGAAGGALGGWKGGLLGAGLGGGILGGASALGTHQSRKIHARALRGRIRLGKGLTSHEKQTLQTWDSTPRSAEKLGMAKEAKLPAALKKEMTPAKSLSESMGWTSARTAVGDPDGPMKKLPEYMRKRMHRKAMGDWAAREMAAGKTRSAKASIKRGKKVAGTTRGQKALKALKAALRLK